MSDKIANTGNKGSKSDCFISLELTKSKGIQIELKSKVDILYGKSIKELVLKILQFFEINNAKVQIEDSGALDFVIAARLEGAIKKLISTKKEYLLENVNENKKPTDKDKKRFSRLYLPGNTPKFFINAGIYNSDGIILDLEDSVSIDKKQEAQFLVRNALRSVNFYDTERMVRINQIPKGLDDLNFVVSHNVNLILIPKVESAEQIKTVDKEINKLKKDKDITYPIWFMPIIESALGVINAYEIASASKNNVALAIGLEDYTADIGTKRTQDANESFFARTSIVNAAKAARIQAIDSVFSDIEDMQGLKETIKISKGLGFEGMGCIHPGQIPVIHESYAPEKDDIEKAKKIVLAFDEAQKKGLAAVSLGSKMIDPPVVKRALKIINIAITTSLLKKNWKDE
ncbi:MAG: aldolase/citrate lyase family protein [Bacteroidota bacterium]|nr:aldolase/citrate lyase family protein [Bacteroidota bacterium]